METPNKAQEEFINSKNSNVLVSASAGSGKTYSMIKKLLDLLCSQKTPISSLLVLTFTEAAASEIKQRLYNEISSMISLCNGDDRKFLQKQLDNINNAEIGTLHSVCKKLIVKYFYELDISPDFSVMSEKESKYLLDSVINDVFEERILNNDEEFFQLYDCYNSKRNDTTIKSIIIQLINYINNKNNYQSWLNQTIEKSFNLDLNNNSVCKYLLDISKQKISKFKTVINDLITMAKNEAYDKYIEFLYNRFQFIDEICCVNKFTEFIKVINNPLLKKPSVSKKMSASELEFDEIVSGVNKQLSDTLKHIRADLIFDSEAEICKNFELCKINVDKIIELVQTIKERYNFLKHKKNYLDFNDLEDKMIELLNSTEIVNTLKTTYKYIFFDEYQDINEKQEKILLSIVSGDNYYMIGDVKQSIYAFRQSSPKIFIDKFNKFKEDNIANKVINFNKNQRSDRNILEFNNFVFDTLITEDTIGIDYKSNSRFDSINGFEKTNVDIKVINNKSDSEEDEDIDKDRQEAIVIANSIADILTKTKKDGTRFTFRDIAIILRKRGSFLKTLCQVLKDMQIPITTTLSSDFFGSFEISLMLSILRVVSNYQNDIATAVVLKNLFDLDEKSLLKIRQSTNYRNFYECVDAYNIDDDIKVKLVNFRNFLNISRQKISQMNLCEFIEDVISEYKLLEFMKSLPSGDEREYNLYEFLLLLDNDSYKFNIDKFLEYVDFISKDSALQKIGVSGNSIEICTIHHSKGLEYPAVIIGGMGKKFSLNKDTNDMIINEKFGIGLKAIDNQNRLLSETLIRKACKQDNKQSEINEEIRLLYVAMTRPKEYLCMVGQYYVDNIVANKTKPIYSSNNYFDMIFKAVDNSELLDFNNLSNFTINSNLESIANVEIIKLNEIIDDAHILDNKNIIGGIDVDLKNEILKVYKNKPNLQSFTIKNTVTNILKEESDYENLNYIPKKLDVTDSLISKDYLKIGTAYHSVMQNLKFTESKSDIENLINGMMISGELQEDVVKDIKVSEIFNAKENLKELILNADCVYREKQFLMQENYNKIVKNSDNNTRVIIQGVIDLVIVKDGEAILIDYKTNRSANIQELIDNYSIQLQIYKHAFEKATNIKINKLFLYSFYLNKLIEVK